MKKLLATIATIFVGLVALPEKAEASPHHGNSNSYTYKSGHAPCGCAIYTKRVIASYDYHRRPVYRYYKVPFVHTCGINYGSSRYYGNKYYGNSSSRFTSNRFHNRSNFNRSNFNRGRGSFNRGSTSSRFRSTNRTGFNRSNLNRSISRSNVSRGRSSGRSFRR